MHAVWKIYVTTFHCLIVEEFIHNFRKHALLGIEGSFNDTKKLLRNKSIDSIDFEYSHEERMLSLFVKFS